MKRLNALWQYANPAKFMALSEKLLWPLAVLTLACILGGLIWGFFFTPDDFRQGSTVKIFYLHVPTATMATGIWFMMVAASLVWFIRRHPVSALAAKAAAPIGIIMTLVAMATGAIWGKPMWGTYWAWDPRLTAFMILLVFYFGYIALWQAIEDRETASDLTSILCIVGTVFAVISRYAVNFWNQGLHQGASMSVESERAVADVFFYPALVSLVGFFLLFLWLLLVRTRMEIRRQRIAALLARGT
ncbi:MAG: heme ABC transporter permease CcmC [Pseudomonadota bacterium]